jgi:hypothetical protein
MSQKYLIKEFKTFINETELLDRVLTEYEKTERQNGTLFLAGTVQASDTENGNGRKYPRHVLEREVKNYMKLIRENRAVGECDHPGDDRVEIELKNVSHVMTDLWWEGNELKGKLKILNTPCGNIVKGLVKDGIMLGISSRGLGSTKTDHLGKTIVEDDYQLICWDIVSEPSTTGAFVTPLREGVDHSARIFDKSYKINRILNTLIED